MDEKLFEECLTEVNSKISSKNLEIVLIEDEGDEPIMELTRNNRDQGCIDVFFSLEGTPCLLIYDNGVPAAYLYFSLDETPDGEYYIGFNLSCTDIHFRRRRLSTFLRMVIFLYAISDPNISYVASDANQFSFALLQKYGFEGRIKHYLETFNNSFSIYVSTSSGVLHQRVYDFFNQEL
jgi:hypothetical protein